MPLAGGVPDIQVAYILGGDKGQLAVFAVIDKNEAADGDVAEKLCRPVCAEGIELFGQGLIGGFCPDDRASVVGQCFDFHIIDAQAGIADQLIGIGREQAQIAVAYGDGSHPAAGHSIDGAGAQIHKVFVFKGVAHQMRLFIDSGLKAHSFVGGVHAAGRTVVAYDLFLFQPDIRLVELIAA